MSKKPVTLLIVGAGDRGTGYSQYARAKPGAARVVGVAEPRDHQREEMVRNHRIPAQNVFTDWKDAAKRERMADAVIIATQDAMHKDPAVAFARKGYHILLEKPMAPNEADCIAIANAVRKAGVLFAAGHVLRYTIYTRALKRMLAAGAVGDIVSVQHLEPVGYWHQAHSFVRGNWRNEKESSFMLLAKSCHDMDWIRHVVGVPCRALSSFGSLMHFRKENRPRGAAARCLDCQVERNCPYSAKRIYLGLLRRGCKGWPLTVLTPDVTAKSILSVLRDGPYGRCAYACDNDVVDHQVVNMEFDGGRTAVFTMTAFTSMKYGRMTRIFGTRGEIHGDGKILTHDDFLTGRRKVLDTSKLPQPLLGGHGGGDGGLIHAFVTAVATGEQAHILSGVDETLESHRMVFAAEKSRRTGRTVSL